MRISDWSSDVCSSDLVDLTLTEFAIVLFLVSQQGGDVSYRQIYDIVRGKDFVAGYGPDGYRAHVRSFIKRIRKKFPDVDDNFDGNGKYHGFGYRRRDQNGKGGSSHSQHPAIGRALDRERGCQAV